MGGHIPLTTREFIALVVTLTTQRAYCINVHIQGAKRARATKEKLAKLIGAAAAAAVRAGATMGYGLLALRLFDE